MANAAVNEIKTLHMGTPGGMKNEEDKKDKVTLLKWGKSRSSYIVPLQLRKILCFCNLEVILLEAAQGITGCP